MKLTLFYKKEIEEEVKALQIAVESRAEGKEYFVTGQVSFASATHTSPEHSIMVSRSGYPIASVSREICTQCNNSTQPL